MSGWLTALGPEGTALALLLLGHVLGDQVAHLLVILVGWSLMDPSSWTVAPVAAALGGVDRLPWPDITSGALYLAAFVFAHEGGNTIVRGVLPEEGPDSEEEEDLEGRISSGASNGGSSSYSGWLACGKRWRSS